VNVKEARDPADPSLISPLRFAYLRVERKSICRESRLLLEKVMQSPSIYVFQVLSISWNATMQEWKTNNDFNPITNNTTSIKKIKTHKSKWNLHKKRTLLLVFLCLLMLQAILLTKMPFSPNNLRKATITRKKDIPLGNYQASLSLKNNFKDTNSNRYSGIKSLSLFWVLLP